jgi:hypothetical protein
MIDLARWALGLPHVERGRCGCGALTERGRVFVSMDEGRNLQRITKTAKNPTRMPRAIVVLMFVQDQDRP